MTTVASLLAPLVVMVAVWLPHFAHYYTATPQLPAALVERARLAPDDALLRELAGLVTGFGSVQPVFALPDAVPAATALLGGELDVPGLPRMQVTLPFAPDDLDEDSDEGQLTFAAFALPQLLLRAYRQSGEDRYLFAARDMIVGWAEYERRAWLPRGFLWNDHAVAARIPVLAAFWLAYRQHPAYDPTVGTALLTFVARSGSLLARPAHFTVRTNHGVMQNLALWHLALAFPMLPESAQYRTLALARLEEQMGFYIDDEGVVLEHSAGYQRAGVELLGMALRYLTLMDVTPPPSWVRKYTRALDFYTVLRRPDGSLPAIGDTTGDPTDDAWPAGPLTTRVRSDHRSEPLAYRAWPVPDPQALYPVAGYSIWWSGLGRQAKRQEPSQTMVAWSYFPGHGHKHADEMSVILWGAGRTWVTNVGYWPYGVPGRSVAKSWNGSNAPHLVDEPAESPRSTRLISSGWSESLAALDLVRRGGAGYTARRQIVHVDPDLWIVMDHASGAPGDTSRVLWTTAADLRMRRLTPAGLYRIDPPAGPASLSLRLATSPGATIRELRGSHDPFAGWHVVGGRPRQADTVLVDQPARDSWTIAVWCLATRPASPSCPDRPISARFHGDEDWSVAVPRAETSLAVTRHAESVQISREGVPGARDLILQPGPDIGAARARIRVAFEAAAQKYPRFRDLEYYRLRATYALLVLFGLQEIFFAVLCPVGYRLSLRRAAVVAWVAVGVWLVAFYFV